MSVAAVADNGANKREELGYREVSVCSETPALPAWCRLVSSVLFSSCSLSYTGASPASNWTRTAPQKSTKASATIEIASNLLIPRQSYRIEQSLCTCSGNHGFEIESINSMHCITGASTGGGVDATCVQIGSGENFL